MIDKSDFALPIPSPVSSARRTSGGAGTFIDLLLLALAAALLCCSSLVFVPAPTGWLWVVAILAGEWGHYAALICLFVAAVAFSRGGCRLRLSSGVLALLAALVYLVPTARAILIARTLPELCASAFGPEPAARGRVAPFSIVDAFRGIRISRVEVSEHVYAKAGSKDLRLDLYQAPARTTPRPLVVVIHGGSWNGGNKSQLPALNRYLAAEGYAVASINYRHAPQWPFAAARDDVFRAIEFLKANAVDFGVDATRIVLIGRSAGAQLALSAAYGEQEPAIRGVVDFYGPTDLVFGYEKPSAPGVMNSRKVLRNYLGGTPAEKPGIYAAASPVNYVAAKTPPTLLIQGLLDPIVWPMHSELLDERLKTAARPYLLLRLPWATHGCDANLSGPSGQLSLYAIDRFLAAVLSKRAGASP